jgi:exonuclease SbcC
MLLQKFAREKQEKDKEIESLSKLMKTEQEAYERVQREEEAVQKKQKYLEGLLRENERIETLITTMTGEVHREKNDVAEKKQELQEIGLIRFDSVEYERVKKQVDGLYQMYQSSLGVLSEKKEQLTSLKLDLEKKEGEQKLLAQEMKNLQEQLGIFQKVRKRIQEEQKDVQSLGMLCDLLVSFRTHLISRIRPTLSTYASGFFEQLTDGKYREIELDEDYNLFVYDAGQSYSIQRFSGGEEDLVNLCLRLAISEVITERAGGVFNFIILDEIFGSQDMIRRHNIMRSLQGLSSKFRQIFLITHIEDVKNLTEHVLMVQENQEGISTVQLE